MLGRAGESGRKQRLEDARQGKVDFNVTHSLVMPQEFYEKQDEGDEGRDVIDLRDQKAIGKVKFIEKEHAI
jgi:hypothetical protein